MDNQIAGVIRVTVYDCTNSTPQVLAERLVYRQPRQLVIRAAETKKSGGAIWLSVANEKGKPVAAALAVTVLDGSDGLPASEKEEIRRCEKRETNSGLGRRGVGAIGSRPLACDLH